MTLMAMSYRPIRTYCLAMFLGAIGLLEAHAADAHLSKKNIKGEITNDQIVKHVFDQIDPRDAQENGSNTEAIENALNGVMMGGAKISRRHYRHIGLHVLGGVHHRKDGTDT